MGLTRLTGSAAEALRLPGWWQRRGYRLRWVKASAGRCLLLLLRPQLLLVLRLLQEKLRLLRLLFLPEGRVRTPPADLHCSVRLSAFMYRYKMAIAAQHSGE